MNSDSVCVDYSDGDASDVSGDISVKERRQYGLFSITGSLKMHKMQQAKGESTPTGGDNLDSVALQTTKPRKRRMDRSALTNCATSLPLTPSEFTLLNNNNHVKNERLSPGTPDTSSRSPSVTPSSATHPDTPPALDNAFLLARNCSDIMRSLAARYNHSNPNDYFNILRNGFPSALDPRLKAPFTSLLPNPASQNKDVTDTKKPPNDLSLLNPFTVTPYIDMSSTKMLQTLMRTANEAQRQDLMKNLTRTDSPLDLSSAAPPPVKRIRKVVPSSSNSPVVTVPPTKRRESVSPRPHEDISNWSVDDVCNFVSGIDICAEYAQTFREQSIDGSGLPLLTEEHLTSTMNMKLGPALKLRSILAGKLGSCNICLHCSHCHTSGSPDPTNTTGSTSDSGGTS